MGLFLADTDGAAAVSAATIFVSEAQSQLVAGVFGDQLGHNGGAP